MNSISNEKIQANQLFIGNLTTRDSNGRITISQELFYCDSIYPNPNSNFYVLTPIPYSSLAVSKTPYKVSNQMQLISSFNKHLSKLGFKAAIDTGYHDYQIHTLYRALQNAKNIYGTKDKLILKDLQDTAVNWWADFIKSNNNISHETLKKFKYYLAGQIKVHLYATNTGFMIGIDYKLDSVFNFVKNKSDIKEHIIPIKTKMYFNRLDTNSNSFNIKISQNNELPITI